MGLQRVYGQVRGLGCIALKLSVLLLFFLTPPPTTYRYNTHVVGVVLRLQRQQRDMEICVHLGLCSWGPARAY